ncbi:mature-parasite-infected erythrocyte surface antigen [Reticulomyxa filosa]|uniref:Mature-parasite-infected erythrocyte surface antigen n=1 Tax=Reticulomyxa filosa TaxID=46433 RepID=X6M1L1_RETFI|nr:mature-parasite-infected erythrocyte surface antigen [Reticulomyxa filosa]|eukprot:ETO07302.1 mature-parasite-infected erythrocyte surface antigen [Reticulomyxa filosa]
MRNFNIGCCRNASGKMEYFLKLEDRAIKKDDIVEEDDTEEEEEEEEEDDIEKEEEALTARVILHERKILIKMKELTVRDLLYQYHNCLEPKDVRKIGNENVKLQVMDMKDSIIESEEVGMKDFKSNGLTFKIVLTPLQQQRILERMKIIKNALVIMVAISEYADIKWSSLKHVHNDCENFQQLFKNELGYDFVKNENAKMNKEDVHKFLSKSIVHFNLYANTNDYDGL